MSGYDILITESGRRELLSWLRLNDLNPNDVATGYPLRIECDENGTWGIRHTVYVRGSNGLIKADPVTCDPVTEERFTPLEHDPPMKWLQETV